MNWVKVRRKLIDQKYLLLMVIPGIIWMLIFNYTPMYGIIIAFKDYKITKPISEAEWVGLKHVIEFFKDERFFLILKNTLGISFLKLIIGFPLPILFAIMLNEVKHNRFKKVVQTISYLPHFLSWVVLGGIMITWLSESGLLNELLLSMGLIKEAIPFIAKSEYFWGVVIVSDIWKELGWNAIIYLAAISGIDQSMYEAATVDGAGRLRKIWNITLPSIAGTITILLILAVGNMMNSNFDQIFVLKNTLNADASDVIDIFVYRMGIQSGRFSFATAAGLFKSLTAVVLLVSTNTIVKKINNTSLF
ncbi:ABC transporter permease [Scatolibacter rhodanostii]|uniref:ABC transporter permease n=1 Tax=Scatolibacter rhodanostii TaxID=2014781 RepID=UPI001FA83938|nr:ABC transporter permease subunit [Scatolibacter rhodanostii]